MKRSKGKHNTRAHHGKISGFRRSYKSATKLLERERNHIRTTGRERRVRERAAALEAGRAAPSKSQQKTDFGTARSPSTPSRVRLRFPAPLQGHTAAARRGAVSKGHTSLLCQPVACPLSLRLLRWPGSGGCRDGELQGKADCIRRKRPRSPRATAQLAKARKALGPRRDFSDSATGTARPPLRRNPGPDARPDHPARTQNTGVFWPAGSQAHAHARVHTRMYTQPPSPVQEAPSDQSKLRNREQGAKNL